MSYPFRPATPLVLAALTLLLAVPAAAQRYGQGGPRPAQSLAASVWLIDFDYNGGNELLQQRYDYAAPAYGIVFTRPSFAAHFAYGRSAPDPSIQPGGDDLTLLDASLFTWADALTLLEAAEGEQRLALPITLHSGYRRVSQSREEEENSFADAFGVTVVGLGTGLTGVAEFGRAAFIEARALAVLGLATRSIGDANGNARLLDADVQLHLGPLVSERFGLSAGYNLRWQVWNVGSSDLFQDIAPNFFDYRGLHHGFRVGVSF